MNFDFTEEVEQCARQMDRLAGALNKQVLVYAEPQIDEEFVRYCRHSHRAWRAIQRRKARCEWRQYFSG